MNAAAFDPLAAAADRETLATKTGLAELEARLAWRLVMPRRWPRRGAAFRDRGRTIPGIPGEPGGAAHRRGSRIRDCGIRNCGICGTRCGRASGTWAVRAFRDNRARTLAAAACGSGARFPRERRRPRRPARSALAAVAKAGASTESRRPTGARPRGGAPSSTMPARTPAVPGRSAGRGSAMRTPLAPSGFRETPRAGRPRGHPDRLPIKARSRPLRERTMVRPQPGGERTDRAPVARRHAPFQGPARARRRRTPSPGSPAAPGVVAAVEPDRLRAPPRGSRWRCVTPAAGGAGMQSHAKLRLLRIRPGQRSDNSDRLAVESAAIRRAVSAKFPTSSGDKFRSRTARSR